MPTRRPARAPEAPSSFPVEATSLRAVAEAAARIAAAHAVGSPRWVCMTDLAATSEAAATVRVALPAAVATWEVRTATGVPGYALTAPGVLVHVGPETVVVREYAPDGTLTAASTFTGPRAAKSAAVHLRASTPATEVGVA